MALTLAADPGPLARLREVTADPHAMSIIVQRITDADAPETLRDIAKSWRVPLGQLSLWITEDAARAEQYASALKLAGEMAALDVVKISDIATPEDVQVRKLQIDARKWYSAKLSRERFGESTEIKHTGNVSLLAVLAGIPKGATEIDVTPVQASDAGGRVLGGITIGPAQEAPEKISEKSVDFGEVAI